MNNALNNALKNKNLVKIIAGINNTNVENVTLIAQAAQNGNANALDVAANVDVVKAARNNFNGILFASSVNPNELANAIAAGADVAEVGNFDAMYENGEFLTYSDVLKIAEETKALLPEGTPLCVTIPGFLPEEAQVRLAEALENLNITMIQTEGVHKSVTHHPELAHLTAEDKANLTFRNTNALNNATNLPILTATGLNANNVNNAFAAGASAVGIGTAVNSLNNLDDMTNVVNAVMNAVANSNARQLAIA